MSMEEQKDAALDKLFAEILAEIREEEASWCRTIQVGDWVDCREDRFYLSGPQYFTKDKLYQAREVDIRTDPDTGKVYSSTVIVDSDYIGEDGKPERQWLSNGRVIIRDGVIIWRSHLQQLYSQGIAAWEMLCTAERDNYLSNFYAPSLEELQQCQK